MRTLSLIATIASLSLANLLPSLASAQVFQQTNLITDDPTVHQATITDPLLKNSWGIAVPPAGPFWISDNATGVSTLYTVDANTNIPVKQGLTVTIPGGGEVTGQVFNGGNGFGKDAFLFVSEDGTISGWRGALGTAAETLQAGASSNVYKGAAIATVGSHTYLYTTNFRTGNIDVIKGDAAAPTLTGTFHDATIPAGFAPFNIKQLNGVLYVTYAKQDTDLHDDVAGKGNGFVDAFDLNGNLLGRVGSAGALDSPWGLVIAPDSFGQYAGDLLVGNFGDGHINAFDLATDTFVGQLQNTASNPLAIDGLWGLTVGNNGAAGNANTLFFSSGPDGETHGVFGSIQAVPEPGSVGVCAALFIMSGIGFLRRHHKSAR